MTRRRNGPKKKIRLRYYGSCDYSNKDELFLEKKLIRTMENIKHLKKLMIMRSLLNLVFMITFMVIAPQLWL